MNRAQSDSIDRRVHEAMRMVCVACMFFIAGLLIQSRFFHTEPVKAAPEQLYQLMIYHALPGKGPALETIFHDVSALQSKHGLKAIGYWVPEGDDPAWKDTFVYLMVHSDRQSADANWNALHTDPDFEPYFKAAAPLIQQKDGNYQVDVVYMRPADYSASK